MRIELFNVEGKKFISTTFNLGSLTKRNYELDGSKFPSGVYLYQITNANGTLLQTGKVIFE